MQVEWHLISTVLAVTVLAVTVLCKKLNSFDQCIVVRKYGAVLSQLKSCQMWCALERVQKQKFFKSKSQNRFCNVFNPKKYI